MKALVWDEVGYDWAETPVPDGAETLEPMPRLAAVDSANFQSDLEGHTTFQKVVEHSGNLVGMGVWGQDKQTILVIGDTPEVTAATLNTLFTDEEMEEQLYAENSASFDWEKVSQYLLAN
jgi:hypothetical protein